MKFFIDANGVIFSVDQTGKSNHPLSIQIKADQVNILDGEGFVSDTYTLWDSLHSLAVAISPKAEIDASQPLSLDDAIEEIHQSAEKFKNDWMQGHKENPENYPLEMPSENNGMYVEQFLMSLN